MAGEQVSCADRPNFCQRAVGCDSSGGCLYESTCPPDHYCQSGQCCPNVDVTKPMDARRLRSGSDGVSQSVMPPVCPF
jgi:hypothetical protein